MIDKMAKDWSEMSKAERQAAGGSKKEYNKETGQARYAEGGSLADKATTYKPAVEPTAERTEAAERAQNYSASSNNSAPANTGDGKKYSRTADSLAIEKRMIEEKKAKEAAKSGGGSQSDFVHKMAVANASNRNEGQFKDQMAQMMNGMSRSQQSAFKKDIYDQTKYMKKNGVDVGYDGPTKQESMGNSVSLNASAVDFYNRRDGEVRGPSGTGHRDEFGNATSNENLANTQDAVGMLRSTGHDFTYGDVLRHKNGGKKVSGHQGLYDGVGGYDNWYKNHSAYGEGGFKGSADVMSRTEINDIEFNRTNVGKQFDKDAEQRSNDYWESLQ